MKKKYSFFFCFVSFLIFPTIQIFAQTNWYIDKDATGSNSGSSWSNAWVSFGDIKWGSISPGDNIFISGGSDSTVYNESLTVSKSGTSGNKILITKGTDSGHNGKVIINGEGTRASGVVIGNCNYINVRGIIFENLSWAGVKIDHSNYVTAENCTVRQQGRAGVFVQYSTGVEIKGCTIETGSYINAQTDGIYSQYTVNDIYDHNHIVINNSDPGGHDDCIQSYKDNNLTVHSNYCEQNNSKTSNAQGIFATVPQGGTFRFYNNVVNLGNAESNGMSFLKLGGTGTVEIIGNTLFGVTSYSLLYVSGTNNPVIKNNIIYSNGTTFASRVLDWNGNSSNINNNIIYVSNSTHDYVARFCGVNETWRGWQALGLDVNGYNANPKFISTSGKDFSLQAGSPAINAGTNLGSPYNVDINGNPRPSTGNWDIGAYQSNNPTGIILNNQVPNNTFKLDQNYPNPFNPTTNISFSLPKESFVTLKIYNILGAEIKTLVNENKPQGNYNVEFDGTNLASGIYLMIFQAGNFIQTKKMVLLK